MNRDKTATMTIIVFAALGLLLSCSSEEPCETTTVGEVSEVLAEAYCSAYAACWDVDDASYQAYCERYLYSELCYLDGTCDVPLDREVYGAVEQCIDAIYDLTSATCTTLVHHWPAECNDVLKEIR